MEFKSFFVDLSGFVHNEDTAGEVLKLLIRRDAVLAVKIQRVGEPPIKEVCIYTKKKENPICFRTGLADSELDSLIDEITGKGKEIGFTP